MTPSRRALRVPLRGEATAPAIVNAITLLSLEAPVSGSPSAAG